MTWQRGWALARLAVSLAAVAALARQFSGVIDDPARTAGMFFSEFTTQSNLIVAAVFLAGAAFAWSGRQPGAWWDMVRGAMVPMTLTTFVVYRFLVKGTRLPADGIDRYADWASDLLHVWIPIAVLVDWLVAPILSRLDYRRIPIWATYPVVFCAYSLIRGPIVDWYPYDFLDPAEAGGWLVVAATVAAITVAFLVVSAGVAAIGNWRRVWRPADSGRPHSLAH